MGELEAQVAPFRIDGQYSDYRRPDDVIFTDKAEEDLKRRDFTINAMMASPQEVYRPLWRQARPKSETDKNRRRARKAIHRGPL